MLVPERGEASKILIPDLDALLSFLADTVAAAVLGGPWPPTGAPLAQLLPI